MNKSYRMWRNCEQGIGLCYRYGVLLRWAVHWLGGRGCCQVGIGGAMSQFPIKYVVDEGGKRQCMFGSLERAREYKHEKAADLSAAIPEDITIMPYFPAQRLSDFIEKMLGWSRDPEIPMSERIVIESCACELQEVLKDVVKP